MGRYEELRKAYPEIISKEQLYKICHMAKETAKFYLDNGYITCTARKTEKSTRYSIHIDDVITFLEKRDRGELPRRSQKRNMRPKVVTDFKGDRAYQQALKRCFTELVREHPDAVTSRQMAKAVGLTKTVIQRYVLYGYIGAQVVGKSYMIPKPSMISFMMSSRYLDGNGSSERFKQVKKAAESAVAALTEIKMEEMVQMQALSNLSHCADCVSRYYLHIVREGPGAYSPAEIADLLSVSLKLTRHLMKEGHLQAVKIGNRLVIPQKTVVDYLSSRKFKENYNLIRTLWLALPESAR